MFNKIRKVIALSLCFVLFAVCTTGVLADYSNVDYEPEVDREKLMAFYMQETDIPGVRNGGHDNEF